MIAAVAVANGLPLYTADPNHDDGISRHRLVAVSVLKVGAPLPG